MTLVIPTSEGRELAVSQRWLRSVCECLTCGDSTAGFRWSTPAGFDAEVAVHSVASGSDSCEVLWADGHESSYSLAMIDAAMTKNTRPNGPRLDSLLNEIPEAAYDECLSDDMTLLNVLRDLKDVGVVKISGAPTEARGTAELARRFGPIRTTSYGEVQDFLTSPSPKTAAETGRSQVAHTDEPFRYSPPGFLFFHSVVAAPEGEGTSTLVDGFAVAEHLRRFDAVAFETLCSVPVRFHRIHSDEVFFETRSRVITLGPDDSVGAIRFNSRCLAPIDPTIEHLDELLDALAAFSKLIESPDRRAMIHLNSGEMLVFDNHRIMHGRTAFTGGAARHLRSCNVDRDAVHSAHRVLAGRIDGSSPARGFAQGPAT